MTTTMAVSRSDHKAAKAPSSLVIDFVAGPPSSSGRPVRVARVTAPADGRVRPRLKSDRFRIRKLSVTGPDGAVLSSADGAAPVSVLAGQTVDVAVEHVLRSTAATPANASLTVVFEQPGGPAKGRLIGSFTLVAPVTRRILLVVDGRPEGRLHATYSPGIPPADDAKHGDYFTYSHVARTLAALPGFSVVRAHRDTDQGDPSALAAGEQALFRTDFPQFRFDNHDLAQYDQIWLLGTGKATDTAEIGDSELIAIAQFMDAGGGVYATGDHEDIGQPLCGRVLRVRSMRKWWFAQPGPNGEPRAPDASGPRRHDTTRPGEGESPDSGNYRFDNQSDDRAQPIALSPAGAKHPIVALPGGRTLALMPDHMHEGEVIDPFDPAYGFGPTVTYGTTAFTAYPGPARPAVLALANVIGGHATISTEPNHIGTAVATARDVQPYGAIGAYDGHSADVGRVVVQSTFHHLTDVNLIGDLWAINADGTVDPVRRQGFTATDAGRAALADITAYIGNVARWLTRSRRSPKP